MTNVCAHRGASLTFKENTLEAFTHAVALGCEWVELDVWLANDGNVVVYHDEVTSSGVRIEDADLTVLPNDIPLLNQALKSCTGAHVNIELKISPSTKIERLVESVLSITEEAHAGQETLLSSFSRDALLSARKLSSSTRLGALIYSQFQDAKQFLQGIEIDGFQAIHPHYSLVNGDFVKTAHYFGLQVNVWTVNDPKIVRKLVDLGVDSIITDNPEMVRKIIDA